MALAFATLVLTLAIARLSCYPPGMYAIGQEQQRKAEHARINRDAPWAELIERIKHQPHASFGLSSYPRYAMVAT